jgi:DNA repair protein RadD
MLRDYQQAAVDSLLEYFRAHPQPRSNPLVAMPTGTGKSWVIAAFLRLVYDWQSNARVLMLTHVKKLIEQNFEKLVTLWPTAPAGIYSAGLKRRELNNAITYAGIASLIHVLDQIGHVDLIVVDEAHLVSHNGETMYRQLFDYLYTVNPKLKIIGLSATCYRMGLGSLTEGGIFSDVAFDLTTIKSFNWLIEHGYLAPLHAVNTSMRLDADAAGVRIQGGEYVQRDLQDKLDRADINVAVCKEICEIAYGKRQRWKVFASGIEHAEHISSILNGWGISTVAIHSKLEREEHDNRFRDYIEGRVTCAVSMDEMTTGVDIPEMDFIAVLRPTRSTARWVQLLGRGTRPAPWAGKTDCLVGDFTNNTRDLGPINDPVLPLPPRLKKSGGAVSAAPVRECPECKSWVHASIGTCPYCGHFFATPTKLLEKASGLEVMKTKEDEPIVEEIPVTTITYNRHEKKGRADSLVVGYHCIAEGIPRMFKEYVCLEHEGKARDYAHRWWTERCPQIAPPSTVQRAIDLSKQLRIPRAIRVWVNKRHPEIMSYVY